MITNRMNNDTQSPATDQQPIIDRHLWEFRAVQDVFWIGLGVLTVWFGYQLRGIFVPMLVGLGLAYTINPLLVYVNERWHWPRSVVIGGIIAFASMLVALAAWFIVPMLVDETRTLVDRAPKYFDAVSSRLEAANHPTVIRGREWLEQKMSNPLKSTTTADITGGVETTLSMAGSVFGVLTGVALVPIYFCFFAWYFQPLLTRSKQLIPSSRRDPICEIVGRMDKAVGSFLRGRFVVVAIMMVGFSFAFWIAGVPYWLLIGTGTGLISFIPYLSIIGAAIAVLATWIDTQSGGGNASAVNVVVYPLAAFGVVQLLEGWLLTPWIQSKSMEMNPVVIVIVVLIGGSIGGLYGLLLAIPIAGCCRILFTDVMLPRLQEWANSQA